MEQTATKTLVLEIEGDLTTAANALKSAHRSMKEFEAFRGSCKEIADTALDVEHSAAMMREFMDNM